MGNTLLIWTKITGLCIITCVISQVALFAGNFTILSHLTLVIRMMISIAFLLVQLLFMVPFVEEGMKVMLPVQLVLFVFLWTFIVQLIVNIYIFGNQNTIDDYIGICFILMGICISNFRIFS